MPLLHNRISQEELKKRLYDETQHRITFSFYKYFFIEDPVIFRDNMYKNLAKLQVFGRIYIAQEGINAQVSIPESEFDLFKIYLDSIEPMNGIRLNIALDNDGKSFWVLKIKVRDKIVADGITDPGFNMIKKGKYVDAETFNKLSDTPGTIIIDMRNHYEFEVGHFENAIEIPSDTFREQLPLAAELLIKEKDKAIIMYCTGGIRCEKASAYMLHRGFKNVFHLEGGIINYANTVNEKNIENKFHGKNFVFDDRLGERITDEIIAQCHQCNSIADTHINCRNEGCHLLFIQCDVCRENFQGCCSQACADTFKLSEPEQKAMRKGTDKGRMIFNKSRQRLLDTIKYPGK